MNMHAIDAVEYITVIPTLFGYGTMRYDAEDGSPSEYGRVDYPTESEALAEAQGWAIADDIPLDKHAMRLARSMLAASHCKQAAPETVAGLMAEVREAAQQGGEQDQGDEIDANGQGIRPIERPMYGRVHAAIAGHDWRLVATLAAQSTREDLTQPAGGSSLLARIAGEIPVLFQTADYEKAVDALMARSVQTDTDAHGLTALDVARTARNWACFDRLLAAQPVPAAVVAGDRLGAFELKQRLGAAASQRVSACITSDRRTVDAKFDASHWLAAASAEAVETLAAADWTGEAAEALAYFEEGRGDDSVIAVLSWCGKSMDLPQDMQEGFTVTVDEAEAMAWLERHRPSVKAVIDAMPSSNRGRGTAASVGLTP